MTYSLLFFDSFSLFFSFFTFTAKAVSVASQAPYAWIFQTVMILCRRQSVFLRRRMNRPRVWLYPKRQWWFEVIARNRTMHDFYTARLLYREHPNEHRVLSFVKKRNTRFRASLSIEQRGLGHRLRTGKCSRSTAATFGKSTSFTHCNIAYEFIIPLQILPF